MTVRLGGKERLEDPLQHRRRHAGPRVADRQAHIFAGGNPVAAAIFGRQRDVFTGDADHPLALHRIPGVDRQVEHGVFQLIAIDMDAPRVLRQLHINLDGFPQGPLQQLTQAFINAPRVEHRR